MGYRETLVDFALEHPDYLKRFGALVDETAALRWDELHT